MKSFAPKGTDERPESKIDEPPSGGGSRNREVDFHGERRSNGTHASTSDPDARLYRKGAGKAAKLCFIGHALMENPYALFVDACLTKADGHAERVAALYMIELRADRPRRITLAADKGYEAEDFVNELRSMRVTTHVAQNVTGRSSAIDRRTTRHDGYLNRLTVASVGRLLAGLLRSGEVSVTPAVTPQGIGRATTQVLAREILETGSLQ